jgi:hypothetical protein
MILTRTKDVELIKKIMTDDEIWEKIKEDGFQKEEFTPVIPSNVVILAACAPKVLGLHRFTQHKDRVLYHPVLLKQYRKEFGRLFFSKGINWFFDNTEFTALEAEIPATHEATINLARHLNFKEIGTIKNGVKKDNQTIDLKVLRLDKWAA